MNVSFKAIGTPAWSINDSGIETKGEKISFSDISSVNLQNNTSSRMINGVIIVIAKGKQYVLAFPYKQKAEAEEALQFLLDNYGSGEQKAANAERREKENAGLVYDLKGVRGRKMKVYEDRCVIKTDASVGALITGNASDGEKTIYYVDCIGVQFKESALQIGYIQLETASGLMNNSKSNFFNENTFTFDLSVTTNEKMREVSSYIKERVSEAKNRANQPTVAALSAADEIKKFKELLDSGIITQEEFDAKKKQLLGL